MPLYRDSRSLASLGMTSGSRILIHDRPNAGLQPQFERAGERREQVANDFALMLAEVAEHEAGEGALLLVLRSYTDAQPRIVLRLEMRFDALQPIVAARAS